MGQTNPVGNSIQVYVTGEMVRPSFPLTTLAFRLELELIRIPIVTVALQIA